MVRRAAAASRKRPPAPGVTTYVKRNPFLAIGIFALCLSVVLGFWGGHGVASAYGWAVFAILGTKLALSLIPPRTWDRAPEHLRVGAVITSYNEDPRYLSACIESLLAQTRPATRIVVVDDCSTDEGGHRLAMDYAREHPSVVAIRHAQNAGKRHALATGFTEMEGQVDVFLCVDSDTILEINAIEEGLAPFSDARVTATTGVVVVANHETNLLTRLVDVRYINAFVGERAAYSRLGSVLCVCGSLAFYRADVVLRHLDTFLTQTFLGQLATVGDDRHLTNWCLSEGKVVLAENAIAHTAAPQRWGHYFRQQTRWGRSFFRESPWMLRHRSPRVVAWWLTLVELAQWLVFSSILVYIVLVHPLVTGYFLLWQYLLFVAVMAMARSVRYFDVKRVHQSPASRMHSFLVTPVYGYLTIFVMAPLRMWSLFTLKKSVWGTRAQGVEVKADRSIQAPVAGAPDRAMPVAARVGALDMDEIWADGVDEAVTRTHEPDEAEARAVVAG